MRHLNLVILALAIFWVPTKSSFADAVEFEHRGLLIAGRPLPSDVKFDISIVDAKTGAENVRAALDILYKKSPFSARAIEKLKAAGNVIILYDPMFPPRELSKVTIAAFLPDYYQKDGNAKDFVSVVSRYGAKWEPRELAPILAHELTGHGMQHLRGRLQHVREVDLECEAYLYQEKAYQDLGFDKLKEEMINFRQVLERHWCADFRTWMKTNKPKGLAHWDKLNPDVPKILKDYLVYIDALRKSGVAGSAVAKATASQQRATAKRLKELAKSNDPAIQYELAQIYADGIGTNKNKKQAMNWMVKSARGGHADAQYYLARAYWKGDGVAKNRKVSAEWAKKAAENGHPGASYTYGAMLSNGDGTERDIAAARKWFKIALDRGIKSAQKALDKLGPPS